MYSSMHIHLSTFLVLYVLIFFQVPCTTLKIGLPAREILLPYYVCHTLTTFDILHSITTGIPEY